MKNNPVAAGLFHVYRQTDGRAGRTDIHNEADSRFSQFSESSLQ